MPTGRRASTPAGRAPPGCSPCSRSPGPCCWPRDTDALPSPGSIGWSGVARDGRTQRPALRADAHRRLVEAALVGGVPCARPGADLRAARRPGLPAVHRRRSAAAPAGRCRVPGRRAGRLVGVTVARHRRPRPPRAVAIFTWAIVGLGLGLIGALRPLDLPRAEPTRWRSYRDAQALIRELLDLSGEPELGPRPRRARPTASPSAVRDELPVAALGRARPARRASSPRSSTTTVTTPRDARSRARGARADRAPTPDVLRRRAARSPSR